MDDFESWDFIDGRRVPPMVVSENRVLSGTHKGSVRVDPGVQLIVEGTVQGSVHLAAQSEVLVQGVVQGSLYIPSGAEVLVQGKLQGSAYVDKDALLTIESAGSLAGSIHNNGTIENFGTRGGLVEGAGQIFDRPGSEVKKPVIQDGVYVYKW